MKPEETRWVTLELSRKGEKEEPEALRDLLSHAAGGKDVEIFVPAMSYFRKDHALTLTVMEGYAFVRAGFPAAFYFEFEKSPYVSKVLSTDDRTGRYLCYVPDSAIQEMRSQLRDQSIREVDQGDEVSIVDGVYAGLEGTVLKVLDNDEDALVNIHGLVSIETVVEFPLQYLKRK